MSAELKDFRGKITSLSWCYLEAESRATDRELQEILRDVVDQWAERKHKAAIEAQRLLTAEGLPGIDLDAKKGR